MMAAFKMVPNVSCGIVDPTFSLGALNWISISGCHFAGTNSGFVNNSNKLGLNAIKHFEQTVTISTNLKYNSIKLGPLNNHYLTYFEFGNQLNFQISMKNALIHSISV